jgi:hypothetical protein
MRFLKLKLVQLRQDNLYREAEEVLNIMNTISTGKYNVAWHDRIIPSLLLIFCGMMISLILIGIMLEV